MSVVYNLTDRSAASVLAMVATADRNQKDIECRVRNIYTDETFSMTQKIEVWFDPVVVCESTQSEGGGESEAMVILACAVRGNPMPIAIRFRLSHF